MKIPNGLSFFLLSFLFMMGCQLPPKKADLQRKSLFPFGSYQQDVEVAVLAKGHEADFDFNGIVKKSADELHFVGFNSFGISLFKIKEANGKVEMESSISQINQKRDFFIKTFFLVKEIVNLSQNDPRLSKPYIDVSYQDLPTQVRFSEYDSIGIPLKTEVETPGKVKVIIQTTNYKLD